MPVAAPLIGAAATIGGGLLSAGAAKSAANTAANAQTQAAQMGIAEERRQYDTTRGDLTQYRDAGSNALQQYLNLLGLGGSAGSAGHPDWSGYLQQNQDVAQGFNGVDHTMFATPEDYAQWHYQNYGQSEGRQLPTTGGAAGQSGNEAQSAAIDQLKNSPLYQALFANGQNTLLANASATGGLRGGNTQSSLANFGRDTLASVIENQLNRLSGTAAAGQNAAVQTGTFGQNSANSIASLLGEQGSAQAGAALAGGAATSAGIRDIVSGLTGVAANPAIQKALFGSPMATPTQILPDVKTTLAANPGIF